jgi:hypothetical protein
VIHIKFHKFIFTIFYYLNL